MNKIKVQLEQATILYFFPPTSTELGPAEALRVPDYCERILVAKSVLKGAKDVVPANTDTIKTCRLMIPTGLVSVDEGKLTILFESL